MTQLFVILTFVGLALAYEYGDKDGSTPSLTCPCGMTNSDKSGRIIGGVETKQNEYPWMAYLDDGCGASVISEYHVLTAAHCSDGMYPFQLSIALGMHNRTGDNKHVKNYQVRKIVQHPDYGTDAKSYNDIAILVTYDKIEFNQYIGPVCLPNKKLSLVGESVKVIGWGIDESNDASNILKELDLEVISHRRCLRSWWNVNADTQLCGYSFLKDSCRGDSGGPVVYLDPETNRYTQVGIVSYGNPNCNNKRTLPSVNTDVSYFIDWIKKSVAETHPEVNVCTKA